MNTAATATESGRPLLLGAIIIAAGLSAGNATAAVGRLPATFDVDTHGAATYTVPISVAPGRNGLRPDIGLHYNSQSGGGLAGMGWTLTGLSRISRCPRTPAVDGTTAGVRYTREDRLCLDNIPLILVAGTWGGDGAEYRAEVSALERVFSRGSHGTGPAWFEVLHTDGRISRYGDDADSRIVAGNTGEVHHWALNTLADRFGNRISFRYVKDDTAGEYSPGEIRWTDDETGTGGRFRLQFDYEPRPPGDVRRGYVWGSPWQRAQRLRAVRYEFDGGSGFVPVHTWTLTYATPPATGTGRSQVAQIQQCGRTDCLPPTNFAWQNGQSGFRTLVTGPADAQARNSRIGDHDGDGDMDLLVPVLAGGEYRWHVRRLDARNPQAPFGNLTDTGVPYVAEGVLLELDGDGLRDLLTPVPGTGTWMIHRSRGDGTFHPAVDAGIGSAPSHIRPLDMDGDGLDDILFSRANGFWFRRNTGSGFGAEEVAGIGSPSDRAVVAFTTAPDFDGDGRQDLLVHFRSWDGQVRYYEAFRSTPAGFSPLFRTGPADAALILDCNGDGLTDLLWAATVDRWQISLSQGNGSVVTESFQLAGVTTVPTLRVLDHDGDGREDLLRLLSGDTWRVHLSSGGAGGSPFSDTDPSRYVDIKAVTAGTGQLLVAADWNGDGQTDLLQTDTTGRWQVLTRNGPRADLLVSATDGLGNRWAPAYQALSTYAGYSASGPAGEYQVLLRGGPLQVVTGLVTGAGDNRTYRVDYSYANGRYHRRRRSFLGFERIRATDSRHASLHGSSVYTESVYHQAFPLTGLTDLTTTAFSSGKLISVSNPTHAAHGSPAAAGHLPGTWHFLYTPAQVDMEYETDPDGGAQGQLVRRAVTSRTYDYRHGVPVEEYVTTVSPRSSVYLSTVTLTTLDDAARTSANCLGLPAKVEITRSNTASSTATRILRYDWSPEHCEKLTETTGAPAPAGEQLITVYVYDNRGRLVTTFRSAVDGSLPPRRTTYRYDPWSSRAVAETDIVPGSTHHPTVEQGWDYGLDVLLSRRNPRGVPSRWTWDPFGRMTQEVPVDGPTSTSSYQACSSACFAPGAAYEVHTRFSDGNWTRTFHDRFGRSVGRESPLPGGGTSREIFELDLLGRISRQSVPFVTGEPQFWIRHTYDVRGRELLTERPTDESGATAATRHSWNGLTVTAIDAANRVTTREHDPAGQLISVSSPAGGTAHFGHGPFGELLSITDANGTTSRMTYDARGLLRQIDSPDSGRRTSDYNAFGELVRQSDAAVPANTISYTYDVLGRVVRRQETGQPTTEWQFITVPGPAFGLAGSVVAPVGGTAGKFTEEYAYDARGRRTQLKTVIDGHTWVTNYEWDLNGRLSRLTYPAAPGGMRPRFRYTYGSTGALARVEQDVTGADTWVRHYELGALDARGRERWSTLGHADTIDEQRAYDRASGLLARLTTGPARSGQIQDRAYAWDPVANLVGREDRNAGAVEQLTYDDLDRLVTVRLNGSTTVSLAYDAGGRIRSRTDVGTYSYTTAHPGAVTAISGGPRGNQVFAYDSNGRMVSRAGRPVTWTASGLPARIEHADGRSVAFAYGPDRRRIRQIATTPAGTITTYYPAPHVELEIRGNLRRQRSYLFVNGRAIYAQVDQDSPALLEGYYLHHDHQGSLDTLTRVAGTGADRLVQPFDVWGKRRNPDGSADPGDQRFADTHWLERGYGGHEHLDAVKLIHMNGRVQDPILGLMLSPDPVLGDPARPQTLNRYAWVAGNPASFTDPSGYFLGRIGRGFRRAVRHLGSTSQRVIRRHGDVLAAAVTAYWTGGLVASAGTSMGLSVAAGDTLGAIAGGAVAGGMISGDLRGAAYGALSAGVFTAIGSGYNGTWTPGRVLAHATTSGALAQAQGASFRDGFLWSGTAALAQYGYTEIVGYGSTLERGGPARGKGRYSRPMPGTNNIGTAGGADPSSLLGEGGYASRVLNLGPGVNAVAGLHDVFQIELDLLGGGRYGSALRNALNVPGMPVAAAMTYPAFVDGAPAVLAAIEEDEP